MAKAKNKKVSLFARRKSKALRRKLDGRTRDVQFLKQTYETLCIDLGGEPAMSFQQKTIAAQCAWQLGRLQYLQSLAVNTGAHDDDKYTRLNASLLKMLQALGLERKLKSAGSLRDVLEGGAS